MKQKIALIIINLIITSLPVVFSQNRQLQDAFAESYRAETAGEFTRAIETLRRLYDEDSYEINLRLGWLTYNNGSFTESAAYYNKAIQLMPYSIEARLGFVLPASAMGNWEAVLTRYQEILKIDPNHYLANYRIGLIYYYRDNFTLAFQYFERIANMYPFDYDAVHMLAWTNLRLRKTREARVLFGKALLIRPGDDSANEGLESIR